MRGIQKPRDPGIAETAPVRRFLRLIAVLLSPFAVSR